MSFTFVFVPWLILMVLLCIVVPILIAIFVYNLHIEYFQTEIIIVFSYEHLLHVLHP